MPDNTTPEKRASRAAQARERRRDPAARERHRLASREYYAKNRAKLVERARAYRANPENRAKAKSWQQKYDARPEIRLRSRKANRNRTESNKASLAGRPRPDCCEVCGRSGSIHFDHCHQHGHFRGWLCRKCNLILGFVDDDPDILRKLIAYLQRAKDYTPPQLTLPGI